MSASIPPNGLPKATVTHECGDIRVEVYGDLTPAYALWLNDKISQAVDEAIRWRHEQLKTIKEAGK
jgi:hypothetical protein